MGSIGVGANEVVYTNDWALPRETPSALPPPDMKYLPKQGSQFVAPERLTGHIEPLKYSGSLHGYENFDTTPKIGTEFPKARLAEWLRHPNSDQLIRDLAITVSRRGVVFFRSQTDLTIELQKELARRIGALSGKPKSSGLHIYPLMHEKQTSDPNVTVIQHEDDKDPKKTMRVRIQDPNVTPPHKMWHADTCFENVPSDYAILRMAQLPKTGGDTIWASGYEVYDRLSKPIQEWLKTMSFTGGQPRIHKLAETNGVQFYEKERGAPENTGKHLRANHPVVRTNPVTGWNSVYCLGHHVEFINDVTRLESERILGWMNDMVLLNHDLQVRHKWINPHDVAIWDNRVVVHTATPDYLDQQGGRREGYRVMSVGERPYFDPAGIGRKDGLEKERNELQTP